MKALLLALAALVLAGPAPAQAPAAPNPIQALDDCVMGNAHRLEISGEAADVVAEAALAKCNRELAAAASSPGMFHSGGPEREELRVSMREAALADIVEMRAARNAAKAPPASRRTRKKR